MRPDLPFHLVMDIETVALPADEVRLVYPKPYASWRGGTEAADHDERWRQWHEQTAALDPARSRIAAVGLLAYRYGAPFGQRILTAEDGSAEAELRLLKALANFLLDGAVVDLHLSALVGHSIVDFDLPYLAARGMAHGFHVLEQIRFAAIIDTAVWFRDRYRTSQGSASLGNIAKLIGLDGKEEGAGGRYGQMDEAERLGYLLRDLQLTWAVAGAMGAVPRRFEAAENSGEQQEEGSEK